MEVAGPLGTPLGLAQQKRSSSRGEARTSGFLSVSDSDRRVPAELGQESHLGQENPLDKEMATHSSILAWKIPWTEEPDRLQSNGSLRVGHN